MPPAVCIELISKMAAIEHRLAYGTSDKLQLGALCGAFAGGCGWASGWVGWPGLSGAKIAAVWGPGAASPAGTRRLMLWRAWHHPCAAEAKEGIVAAAK
jgi:hypothetical protein